MLKHVDFDTGKRRPGTVRKVSAQLDGVRRRRGPRHAHKQGQTRRLRLVGTFSPLLRAAVAATHPIPK